MNLLPIDELNVLSAELKDSEYIDSDGKKKSRLTEKEIEDLVEDFLIYTFVMGKDACNGDLDTDIDLPSETILRVLNRPVGTDKKNWRDRIKEHIDNGDGMDTVIRVADSEMTRVYNESGNETAKEAEKELSEMEETKSEMDYGTEEPSGTSDTSSASEKKIMKKWQTMKDDRVRDTHFLLQGTQIPFDEYFFSASGDSALYPGGFETAEENVNCRCYLTYNAV